MRSTSAPATQHNAYRKPHAAPPTPRVTVSGVWCVGSHLTKTRNILPATKRQHPPETRTAVEDSQMSHDTTRPGSFNAIRSRRPSQKAGDAARKSSKRLIGDDRRQNKSGLAAAFRKQQVRPTMPPELLYCARRVRSQLWMLGSWSSSNWPAERMRRRLP